MMAYTSADPLAWYPGPSMGKALGMRLQTSQFILTGADLSIARPRLAVCV